MNVLRLVGTFALLSFAVTGAHAADLMTSTAPAAAAKDPGLSGFYAEIYGGAALASTFTFYGASDVPYDAGLGWAAGGALGWDTGIDGLAVEVDVLHTHRAFVNYSNIMPETTSLMANAKYSFHLTDSFDVYAGAGLGAINLAYVTVGNPTLSAWGLGYQLMAGAGVNLTDSVSAFAEYRYQNSFGHIDIGYPTYTVQLPSSTVLAGLKFKY